MKDKMRRTINSMILFRFLQQGECSLMRNVLKKKKWPGKEAASKVLPESLEQGGRGSYSWNILLKPAISQNSKWGVGESHEGVGEMS